MTCDLFPLVHGFGILSEMSQPISYTGIVGGSIRRWKLSTSCAACRTCGILLDRLEAARLFLGHIHLQEETVKRVNTFKCLGSTLSGERELYAEVTHRVQNGCKNGKRMCGVVGYS